MGKKGDKSLSEGLRKFIRRVNGKFPLAEAVLFGSRARSDAGAYSDYDIILVSPAFSGLRWHKRIEEVVKLWEQDTDLDVLPYTPEEFEEKKKTGCIVQEAVKQGTPISA